MKLLVILFSFSFVFFSTTNIQAEEADLQLTLPAHYEQFVHPTVKYDFKLSIPVTSKKNTRHVITLNDKSSGNSYTYYYLSDGNGKANLVTENNLLVTQEMLNEYFIEEEESTDSDFEIFLNSKYEQRKIDVENKFVELVNVERAKVGLPAVKKNDDLYELALYKGSEMAYLDYFDHLSPAHGSVFNLMEIKGYEFKYAGENIAKGSNSPEKVTKAWMNSKTHKGNILKKEYTKIGVSMIEHNGVYYVVQLFSN